MSPTEIPALRTKCCKRLSLAHLQTLRSWIHLHSYLHTQNHYWKKMWKITKNGLECWNLLKT